LKEWLKKHLPPSWRYRLTALREAFLLRRTKYHFSFKYFDPWSFRQLSRYIRWQFGYVEGSWAGSRKYAFQWPLLCYSLDEHESLESILKPLSPNFVIDLGCGIGRSSIYFKHCLGWEKTRFLFLDGHRSVYEGKEWMNPKQTFYHPQGPESNQSFYTNFDLLDRFLASNRIGSYHLIDLQREPTIPFDQLPKADLLYSFHSAGYHFALSPFFERYNLHNLLKKGAHLIFGIRKPKDPLRKQLDLETFLSKGYQIKHEEISGRHYQNFIVLQKT